MQNPKFEIGQLVYKWTGDYGGPGRVRGITILPNNKLRYLVGHRIEGGTGEFLHIYAEGNLCETEELQQALKNGPDQITHLSPVETTDAELVDALAKAHQQVDMLLAMVITRDNTFRPSKSPLWPEIERRAELIRKHGVGL